MPGFDNGVLYADNIDFRGVSPVTGQMTTDGELLIGNTGTGRPTVATPTNGNNITWTLGGGSIRADVTGTTQYAIQVGDATGSLDSLAVGTAGQPMLSGGAGANPSWGTLGANYGGTGLTSITDHATMIGSGTGAVTPVGPGTNGQLLIGSTGADPAWATVTSTDGSIDITGGAGTLDIEVASGSAGKLVQQVYYSRADAVSCQTIMPFDNTVPQKTEGDEILTVAITPTNSSNYLLIEVIVNYKTHRNGGLALFQDDGSDAISASFLGPTSDAIKGTSGLRHRMTAGTTSETTFKVRMGNYVGNPNGVLLNTDNMVYAIFNGVGYSSITVTEISA